MGKDRSDFIRIRLTPQALDHLAHAPGQPAQLSVATAHFGYSFSGDTPVEVLTSEWAKHFRHEQIDGVTLFEAATTPHQEEA